ncbi:MAG: hypothetical protein ACYC2R_00880 [Burkholderiales bacterium]|nr:hypothetical protein [Sulfuricellaceae bacterium]
MKKDILIFWIAALSIVFGLSAILYRHAAVPTAELAKSKTPQPMESMPDIDLGSPYGTVSVTDLVGYYIEHPPAPKGTAAVDSGEHRFGGC